LRLNDDRTTQEKRNGERRARCDPHGIPPKNVEKFGTRRAAINGDADEALQFD
jgi:hypothetical protein